MCPFLCSGNATAAILQLLQKLYFLRQPLLSRHTTAALNAVCTSSRVDTHMLTQLLTSILENSTAWEGRDSDTALSLANLLESGLTRCVEFLAVPMKGEGWRPEIEA